MKELSILTPALGAAGQGHTHNLWWILLALVVFALVMPLAYVLGAHGGRPRSQGPLRS
jgi:hypothetical protein